MEWIHHGEPSYTNWVYGEPEATQSQWPGATCGFISAGSEAVAAPWSAEYCRKDNAVICQKQSGQTCPEGWIFRKIKGADYASSSGNKCYKFFLNGNDHLPWYESFQYCKSIGARSLHVESAEEEKMLSQYFHEWSLAGVTRIWLELSDVGSEKPSELCKYTWMDSQQEPTYVDWSSDNPKCNPKANSCAYINTLLTKNNWETGSCDQSDTFACEIEPGRAIHSVPKPTEQYHCPSPDQWTINYKINPETQKCYSFAKKGPDGNSLWNWPPFAKEFCGNYSAQLLTIHSEQEQNFVSKHLLGYSWLNMHLTQPGQLPKQWDDGSTMNYLNWREGKLLIPLARKGKALCSKYHVQPIN